MFPSRIFAQTDRSGEKEQATAEGDGTVMFAQLLRTKPLGNSGLKQMLDPRLLQQVQVQICFHAEAIRL